MIESSVVRRKQTATGGRAATTSFIAGDLALSVGMSSETPPLGFRWLPLTGLARLETGHTPSRRHPEYWGGDIPWIGIRDATTNHGRAISTTTEAITAAGEANSSARLLPAGTVCLSRTASVGYVVVMGKPMATSQDFVNWVCGPELENRYLKYILMAERSALLRFATGTTHQTVYFPEVKAFHVLVPRIAEQHAIAEILGALDDKIESNRRLADILDGLGRLNLTAFPKEPRRLAEVAQITMGSSPPGDTYNETREGIPFYQGVSDFGFRYPHRRVWCSSPVHMAEPGDTLISVRAPVGRLNRASEVCCIGRGVAAARSSFASTLYYALRDAEAGWEPYHSEGTVFGAIGRDDLANFRVNWPSERAGDIESDLLDLEDRLAAALAESDILAALRDALLPELLSGRMRVPEAREQVSALA